SRMINASVWMPPME
nr:Chain D, Protein lin-12 [Caenorhabditis elegans]